VATISVEKVKHFYLKKIICSFGLPKYIVSDNGTQFTSEKVIQLCEEKGIKNTFVSVEHPQANGQAESANKVILMAIKRKLERKDKNWAESSVSITIGLTVPILEKWWRSFGGLISATGGWDSSLRKNSKTLRNI
jgi:transposase InsO family protein